MPQYLKHEGVQFGNNKIKYLMYADDLCLIGKTADDLQLALNNLALFCDNNNLEVNIDKMGMGKGIIQTFIQNGNTCFSILQ